MDRGSQKRSRYEKSVYWQQFAAPCSCSWCLSQFPEGVPILWVTDQRRTFLNAFCSPVQPSFKLTYLLLHHPPYLQQWHCLSPFCPCRFSLMKWSSVTSIWFRISLFWKLPASAQPKLKSPVSSFCSGCNQHRFFFTNKNGAKVNSNAEVSLSSLAPQLQCFSNISVANWFIIKQKNGEFH